MAKQSFFSYCLPAEIIKEIHETGHPKDYAIFGVVSTDLETIYITRGDYSSIKAPFSIFEPTGDGVHPDFTDFEIIDHGQTLRFGPYEAVFDAVLAECIAI